MSGKATPSWAARKRPDWPLGWPFFSSHLCAACHTQPMIKLLNFLTFDYPACGLPSWTRTTWVSLCECLPLEFVYILPDISCNPSSRLFRPLLYRPESPVHSAKWNSLFELHGCHLDMMFAMISWYPPSVMHCSRLLDLAHSIWEERLVTIAFSLNSSQDCFTVNITAP